MATKKTDAPTIDIASLNVWQRLMMARIEFLSGGAKKSGKNLHAEFTYFELVDIVPQAEAIFAKYGLLMIPNLSNELAVASVYNTDKPEEHIEFSIPVQLISEPAKFRMNEVQGVGAAVTYYRRYLYMLVLDLVEADAFDAMSGATTTDDDTPAPAPKRSAKPLSTSDRQKIKEELTDDEAMASNEQTETLKALLKNLLEMDPEQESFVQEIAMRTNSFEDLKATACDALIDNVKGMIEAYSSGDEEE